MAGSQRRAIRKRAHALNSRLANTVDTAVEHVISTHVTNETRRSFDSGLISYDIIASRALHGFNLALLVRIAKFGAADQRFQALVKKSRCADDEERNPNVTLMNSNLAGRFLGRSQRCNSSKA